MPVAIDDAPVPSRFTATSTSVSLVFRVTAPLRIISSSIRGPCIRGFPAAPPRHWCAGVALVLSGLIILAGARDVPIGERARGLVQRRVHYRWCGGPPVSRYGLGHWWWLISHGH